MKKVILTAALGLSTALLAQTNFLVCKTGCSYTSIQQAINDLNNSKGEYTIYVKSGVYKGPIDINKSLNIIGEDPKTTIITGENKNRGIDIETYDNYNEDINISNLTIKDASNSGVYISADDSDSILFKNVIFNNNSADNGGAVHNNIGSPTFKSCEFDNNSASNGGAIYNYDIVNIINSNFNGNSATDEGGAIYDYSSSLFITRSWFIGNSATDEGGAIYAFDDNIKIENSVFSKNFSQSLIGNAIYNSGNMDLESNDFVNNDTNNSNSVYVENDSSYNDIVKNSVFKNSKLIFAKDDSNQTDNSVVLVSNVFDKNGISAGNNINLAKNKFIDSNTTLFVNPASLDFSLTPNSILKDASINNSYLDTDITGTPRPQGPNGDIGACEYPSKCKFEDMRAVIPIYTTNNQSYIAKNVIIHVVKGWNLKSIPYFMPVKVADIIKGQEDNVRTIWFWNANEKKWMVYSPNPKIQKILQNYATLDILNVSDTIDVGAGFWVDAVNNFDLNVPVLIKK